jgi:hypothetical protein
MLRYLLLLFLQRSPILLMIVIGLVFAIIRWRRHPSVSLLTAIALVIYVIKIFTFALINYWLPNLRFSLHVSYAAINNLYILLSVLSDIAFAIVLLILVIAAFLKRQTLAPAI